MTSSEEHPDNVKLEFDGYDLRDRPRWCTDICFAILIVLAWIAMTSVGFAAIGIFDSDRIPKGNPQRLVHSIDYNGSFCGINHGVLDLPYSYYLPNGAAICVEKCPNYDDFTKFICKYEHQEEADKSIAYGYMNVLKFNCMYQVKTVSLLYRCIPESGLNYAMQQAEQYAADQGVHNLTSYTYYAATEKGSSWFKNFLGDMYQLRGYIFGFGIGVTLAVGVIYLYLLRIPYLLTIFIWTIILATFAILLLGSFLLWRLAKIWSRDELHSHPEIVTMYTFSYIGMAITALYFCTMVVMRKRIQLAIGIVKETCKAFATMTGIMLIPILQAIGMVMFLIPWVIYVFYLASSGEAVKQTGFSYSQGVQFSYSYYTYQYASETRYAFIYMLFCLFWTAEFIVAIGQLVMALCFSCWYFTRKKEEISSLTVFWSLRIALVYHLGTAAFGSMIIAIIQTIRAIILYFQKTAKQDGIHGKIMKYALCILQCILWCVEKIMKFINKNAYIITAVYGYSFCKSARKAFFLILRNILRISAVTMVSSIVLFLGQMFVPLCTTFLCYLCLAYNVNSAEVSGIVAPLVFTFFLSYWISAMFMEIFGMGIETILVCFIADEEMNKVDHRYADGDLRTTIATSEAKREELKIPIPTLYLEHHSSQATPSACCACTTTTATNSNTNKETKDDKHVELMEQPQDLIDSKEVQVTSL